MLTDISGKFLRFQLFNNLLAENFKMESLIHTYRNILGTVIYVRLAEDTFNFIDGLKDTWSRPSTLNSISLLFGVASRLHVPTFFYRLF